MEKGRIPTPPYNKVSNYLMKHWRINENLINEINSLSDFNVRYSAYLQIKLYRKLMFFQCYIIALKFHTKGIYVE